MKASYALLWGLMDEMERRFYTFAVRVAGDLISVDDGAGRNRMTDELVRDLSVARRSMVVAGHDESLSMGLRSMAGGVSEDDRLQAAALVDRLRADVALRGALRAHLLRLDYSERNVVEWLLDECDGGL